MKSPNSALSSKVNISKRTGFTLIEMVSVIVLLSVVMLGVTSFMGTGIQIYLDVTERDQLLSDSRFVVERLNRELRTALPNSIRVKGDSSTHCLEFVPIRWSTFYEDIPVAPEPASSAISAINLTGLNGDDYTANTDPSDFVVVYATNEQQIYNAGSSRRFGLASITSASMATINLDNSVRFAADSPMSRLYVVDGQTVSYCVRDVGGTDNSSGSKNLYRHQGNFAQNQQVYTSGGVLMAENIDNTLSNNPKGVPPGSDDPFRMYEATLQRNAFVRIRLRFKRSDEIVVFNNEIHIPNTP
ncbi:prepilin-type N-terminal cleavage/methylation domain-containing protein [Paraneptunicella aestuarii]|uniref:prepilin-type N-terminal cleavage/methylation domain-containing protein n=1 Tax=Paraneptunicella aestuarii TaxID=2831148 RepID=UPI001E600433|nr:prepilin-type N-terminal cleavage/methylation domain-containing protein [Paraneptunicella aestuarii]UAA39098.1 prepilin-type N-terminal cleavage/methylation domain-containing protein [Paraneptunicella aestuarii]